MNIANTIKGYTRQVRTQGFGSAVRTLLSRGHTRLYEWRLGIDTEGAIELSALGLDHRDRRCYLPTAYADFAVIAKMLEVDAQRDVFIDFGAGLGRVVVLAAMMPFKRVIGVELSAELCRTARNNVSRSRQRLACSDVQIINADATEYFVPSDVNVFYFFNPFAGEILDRVLANIKRSVDLSRRDIKIICNLPAQCAFDMTIRNLDWIRLEHEMRLQNARRCLIFAGPR